MTDTLTLVSHKKNKAIIYPESDGKPMAETDTHLLVMIEVIQMLRDHVADDPSIYVSGNLLLYYEEGNPKASVSPDAFVVKELNKNLRRTYLLWAEQRIPCTVFEITSRKTAQHDRGKKHALYARLGVQEYLLFDPLEEYLHPSLCGYQLIDGDYYPIPPQADGSIVCNELGLRLQRSGWHLDMIDMTTGTRLIRPTEFQTVLRQETSARRLAEEQAHQEAEARRAMEAELALLREELQRLRQSSDT